jgi:hypothetical protein
MKLALIALAVAALPGAAMAQTYVHGYTTKNGTYVAPHYRSAPDGNPYNNWSTVGNVNPYTGQVGTKNPYSSYSNPYATPSYTPPSYTSTPCLYCSTTQSQTDSSDDSSSPY